VPPLFSPDGFRGHYDLGYGLEHPGVPAGRSWKPREFMKRFDELRRSGPCGQLRMFEHLQTCRNRIGEWRKDAIPPQRLIFAPGVIRLFYGEALGEQSPLWNRWQTYWRKSADERANSRTGSEFDRLPPPPEAIQGFRELYVDASRKLNERADRFTRTCVLRGDAGVGKSTAAAAIIRIMRNSKRLGVKKHYWLKLRPDSTPEYETVGRAADANENPDAVCSAPQRRTQGRVQLFTDWNVGGRDIDVPVSRWRVDQARTYFKERLPPGMHGQLTEPAVQAAHELLEGLPLAFSQAAAFLKGMEQRQRTSISFQNQKRRAAPGGIRFRSKGRAQQNRIHDGFSAA
jgi:hypothetical protein